MATFMSTPPQMCVTDYTFLKSYNFNRSVTILGRAKDRLSFISLRVGALLLESELFDRQRKPSSEKALNTVCYVRRSSGPKFLPSAKVQTSAAAVARWLCTRFSRVTISRKPSQRPWCCVASSEPLRRPQLKLRGIFFTL